jgi:hypothetical protein
MILRRKRESHTERKIEIKKDGGVHKERKIGG